MGKIIVFIAGLIWPLLLTAQQTDSTATVDSLPRTMQGLQNAAPADSASVSIYKDLINAPARAAFYSAVLPGLGQAYNRQYWKIPIVYATIGGALYFYRQNQTEYLRYRDAYQKRLLGQTDEFPELSTDLLVKAQSYYRRNRDISLMAAVAFYVLNILDANVSAHLRQWNINDRLSLQPVVMPQSAYGTGLSLRWRF